MWYFNRKKNNNSKSQAGILELETHTVGLLISALTYKELETYHFYPYNNESLTN